MSPKKSDRRVERTRKLLHQALHDLLTRKRYDDITVQEIIDQADVGRSTFYAHYQDKEDLAVSELIRIMDELNQAIVDSDPQGKSLLPTRGLFEHISENPHVFSGMLHDRGMEFFFDKGQQYWADRITERLDALLPPGHEPGIPVTMIAATIAGTLVTMMRWWLDNKMPYSADQMAQYADQLILPGIWNALGIDGLEME